METGEHVSGQRLSLMQAFADISEPRVAVPLPKTTKVGTPAAENLCLRFFAVVSQLGSLNQPGVHDGKRH
jgi:hypothetical protein